MYQVARIGYLSTLGNIRMFRRDAICRNQEITLTKIKNISSLPFVVA